MTRRLLPADWRLIRMLTPLLFLVATLVQAVPAPQAFAGTWTAQLKGEPLIRLVLTVSGQQFDGHIGVSGFHVDANGIVDALTPGAGGDGPIFNATLKDGVLSFARKDGDDTDHYELRLADGAAMLTFVVDDAFRKELAREGIPVPKPIRLTRVAGG